MNEDNLDKNLGAAADPQKVKERATKAKLRERQSKEDLISILSSKQGRRFVWGVLKFCRVNELSFVAGRGDMTAFNEGMRNVGQKITADIFTADPQIYVTMQIEAKESEEEFNNG